MRGFDRDKNELDLDFAGNWRRVHRLSIELKDKLSNVVSFGVFGNPWPYKDICKGDVLNLVGRVVFYGGDEPKAFLQNVEEPPAHAIGRIWVQYLGIQGRVSGQKVEAIVRPQLPNPDAYRYCASRLVGELGMDARSALAAADVSQTYDSFESLLKDLHCPATVEDGWRARSACHKLTAMAIQAGAMRHNARVAHPKAPWPVSKEDVDFLAGTQPERLTSSQLDIACKIVEKLQAPKAMNVLLSGDVGTGKTLAYLLPAVAAHRAGAKVTIIAPTTILADQIARQIVTRFGAVVSGVERVVAASDGGRILNDQSILVGTSGLTSVAGKIKYAPDFLICDEQHKLPTSIREKLVKPWTHTLEVSATPIPRSLASVLFNGKDILNLRECPVQKKFHCVVADLTKRGKISRIMREAVARGERVAVVYPRVESSRVNAETLQVEVATVTTGATALEMAFPGQVVAIHGGMADSDITAAIEDVRSGKKPVVVSSIIIETGVDIPGISCMVVRNADYFSISALHQLRGRLVRTGGEGFFAMMVNDLEQLDEETLQRLRAVEQCVDGYALAEKDLVLRGFGDLEGESQSGDSSTVFKLARLRPEDFLRKKLNGMSVSHNGDLTGNGDGIDVQQSGTSRPMQPRLFG